MAFPKKIKNVFDIGCISYYIIYVHIGKHDVGRQFCQHFGPIGFTITKFYSDSYSTKVTP